MTEQQRRGHVRSVLEVLALCGADSGRIDGTDPMDEAMVAGQPSRDHAPGQRAGIKEVDKGMCISFMRYDLGHRRGST